MRGCSDLQSTFCKSGDASLVCVSPACFIGYVYLLRHCVGAQEELPERLLGTCRLEHLDLAAAAHLDTSTGVITRKA